MWVIGSTRGWTVISAVRKTGVTMSRSELVVALLLSVHLLGNRAIAQGEPYNKWAGLGSAATPAIYSRLLAIDVVYWCCS